MRRALLFLSLFLLLPWTAQAQIANPSAVDFVSADQNTIIPVGQVNAGQPSLASYQGMIFAAAVDPSSGVPLVVGPVIAKTLAVAQPATNTFRLTYTAMGLTIPPCTTLPCPQFSLLLVAIGPGGTSARGVASESSPFTARVPIPPPSPAGPANLQLVP